MFSKLRHAAPIPSRIFKLNENLFGFPEIDSTKSILILIFIFARVFPINNCDFRVSGHAIIYITFVQHPNVSVIRNGFSNLLRADYFLCISFSLSLN